MSEEFILKFKAELDGREQISAVFEGAGQDADKFSARMKSAMSGAGSAISAFAGKATSELQSFAGKELGGSLGSQARGVLQLRDAISQLAVSAGGGAGMYDQLNEKIQKTSKATNQLQGDVTNALQAFVERSGDIGTATRNIELYGRVATATSASLEDVARAGEALSSKFNIKDQGGAFAILAAQAKAGAIELRDIATQGNTVFTAARAANIGGVGHEEQGVRQIGGLLQDIAGGARGAGKTTAADTAVQVNAIFSQIRQKADKIEALGVQVGNRNYIDVIRDLITKTGGDAKQLSGIFKNERAFRGISTLAMQYQDDGGFKKLDDLTNIDAGPGLIDRDFATRRGTGMNKLKQGEIDRTAFVNKWLGGIAEFGAAHANELQAGFMGAGLLGKGLSAAGRLGGMLPGGIGDKIASATASRVYVTNWPGGFGGAGAPGLPGGGKAGALLSGMAEVAGTATAVTAIGVAIGAAVGNYLDKHSDLARKGYTSEANLMYKLSGGVAADKKLEDYEASRNLKQLERRKKEREDLIHDFEGKGLSHGKAIYAADQKIRTAQIEHLTVIIADNEAHVQNDDGTRSPKVMVTRGGGGN